MKAELKYVYMVSMVLFSLLLACCGAPTPTPSHAEGVMFTTTFEISISECGSYNNFYYATKSPYCEADRCFIRGPFIVAEWKNGPVINVSDGPDVLVKNDRCTWKSSPITHEWLLHTQANINSQVEYENKMLLDENFALKYLELINK